MCNTYLTYPVFSNVYAILSKLWFLEIADLVLQILNPSSAESIHLSISRL